MSSLLIRRIRCNAALLIQFLKFETDARKAAKGCGLFNGNGPCLCWPSCICLAATSRQTRARLPTASGIILILGSRIFSDAAHVASKRRKPRQWLRWLRDIQQSDWRTRVRQITRLDLKLYNGPL